MVFVDFSSFHQIKLYVQQRSQSGAPERERERDLEREREIAALAKIFDHRNRFDDHPVVVAVRIDSCVPKRALCRRRCIYC